MYRTLSAMAVGIFTALVVSAAIENTSNTTLSGSFGTGEWYQIAYTDILLVAVFGILSAVTRWHRRGNHFLHIMMMAAFATAIAIIFSKWVSQYRANNASPTINAFNRNAINYNRNMYKNYGGPITPVAYTPATNSGCGCAQ